MVEVVILSYLMVLVVVISVVLEVMLVVALLSRVSVAEIAVMMLKSSSWSSSVSSCSEGCGSLDVVKTSSFGCDGDFCVSSSRHWFGGCCDGRGRLAGSGHSTTASDGKTSSPRLFPHSVRRQKGSD